MVLEKQLRQLWPLSGLKKSWYEIIQDTNETIDANKLKKLLNESNELTAIFASSLKTARNNIKNAKS